MGHKEGFSLSSDSFSGPRKVHELGQSVAVPAQIGPANASVSQFVLHRVHSLASFLHLGNFWCSCKNKKKKKKKTLWFCKNQTTSVICKQKHRFTNKQQRFEKGPKKAMFFCKTNISFPSSFFLFSLLPLTWILSVFGTKPSTTHPRCWPWSLSWTNKK